MARAGIPCGVWNFIPRIGAMLDDGQQRYMAFNVGRYEACRDFLGPAFESRLPTASAVGTAGDELRIEVLAADHPGSPVENPRQSPAYRYSRRYGPRPPAFTRATRLGKILFVGGTASIVGEDSSHSGNLDAQLEETLENLTAVVASGNSKPPSRALLGLFTHLRVYYLRYSDLSRIKGVIARNLGNLTDVEYIQAELCRPELLVEVEGLATCSAGQTR